MSTSSKTQSTHEQIQEDGKVARILVIGRANAGKTTILRRLCNTIEESMIFNPNGEKIKPSVLCPSLGRGEHDIENQIIFEGYPGFIFHDSCGFEPGVRELKLVQDFIEQRSREENVNEQLHAIWYCIPTSDDRPFTLVEKEFFDERGTGLVPVIVLWTKTDSLDVAKIKQLMKEGLSKFEAVQQAPQKAWADFEKKIHPRFLKFKYPPKAHVLFRNMNKPGADCKDLIEVTKAVLSCQKPQRYGTGRTVNSTESVLLEDFRDRKEDWALISAQKVNIIGGNLVIVENGGFHYHAYMHPTCDSGKDMYLSGRKKLIQMVASGALYHSGEHHNSPKCQLNTRTVVLKKIMEWAQDLEKVHRFLWLYGPLGGGKSAIAHTIAEQCYRTHILAGTFPFSRTVASCNDSTLVIPTIGYQLSLSIPEVKPYIEAAVERDPNILRLSLETQVQKMIVWPLSQVNLHTTSSQPRSSLIIIDGLDECGDENMQRCLLSALSGVFKSHSFPIYFLITSRPEQHIHESFHTEPLSSMTRFLSLDDSYFPDNDIQVFLISKFDEIKREHPLNRHIPVSWPTERDIKRLVQQSSGQFIYASTVIEYIQSRQHRPTERLEKIFDITRRGNDSPFAELDALYTRIFSLVKVDDIDAVLEVLSILLFSREYWFPHIVNLKLIDGLLNLKGDALHRKLIHLHSILDIPALDDEKSEIRILHASLRDFLQDRTRSKQYYIDGRAHANLTRRLMTLIPSVEEHHSMNELSKLACQFFMVHCVLSYPTPELLADLGKFDISGFLSLLSSEYPLALSPVTINQQISDLFTWLKHQSRTSLLGRGLYTSYLQAWDKHIVTSLKVVSVRLAGLFVASALHPQFWKHCTIIREIVNWKEPQDEVSHPLDSCLQFLCTGEPDEDEPDSTGYYKMLSQFLDDPNRSGPLYADEAKFICLTTKTVQFITNREVETSKFGFTEYVLPYDDPRIWASQCLPFFLSKASHTKVLATLLETDLLPLVKRFKYHSQKKKSEVIDAINNYIWSVSEHMADSEDIT